ncbi:MAG: hypothetical protein KGM42_10175 [Hyphomicrobiales bacterium]|nr:hypothetical protein [Hyphomicrobiales bacterium]
MRRAFLPVCVSVALAAGAAHATAPAGRPRTPPKVESQCARDLASVDRTFADAMRDLQRNDTGDARCTAWRRQIDVMKNASDIFARCTSDEARADNISQMQGSIGDFRALIEEAKCP